MQFKVKTMLLGPCGSGKTSLANLFRGVTFSPEHISTIGIDFCIYKSNGITLQIWEAAGGQSFKRIVVNNYRCLQSCAVVFDLSDEHSFDYARSQALGFRQVNRTAKMVIIGNKSDLQSKMCLNKVYALCNQLGATYYQCSAKQATSCNQLFNLLAVRPNQECELEQRQTRVSPADSINRFFKEVSQALLNTFG